MPTIAMFLGILISMKWDDHMPPHFHAWYQGHKASFLLDGSLLEGDMPPRQIKIIQGWAAVHEDEIVANWEACKNGGDPFKIEGVRF